MAGSHHFDVVILGGGSAGCVLAARLTEDADRRVLLVEAGPDYPERGRLPPEIRSAFRPTYVHDWGYVSEPGALERRIKLPRARVVGGCSATNAAVALRGVPGDYDEWAEVSGCAWGWNDVLPYFRRLERDLDFDGPYHGSSGPLPIRRYPAGEQSPASVAFLAACSAAGHPAVADHNAPDARGAGPLPVNAVDGTRLSTALTWLAEARGRPNLTLLTGALVDRVLVRRGKAAGVRLAQPERTLAADQIVLAAGAYGTPAILMRSGVGPAGHLRALGIPVVCERPGVGEGLIDHPLVGLRFVADPPTCRPPAIFQSALTLKSASWEGQFDLQVLERAVMEAPPGTSPTGAAVMLFAALVKPRSRGSLRLRSPRADDAPAIDLGYFSDPSDLPRLCEAVRCARALARTAPFSDLAREELGAGAGPEKKAARKKAGTGARAMVSEKARAGTSQRAKVGGRRSEGDGKEARETDAELERWVRDRVETYHHPVGTCRMGRPEDALSVVDAQGRVHGIESLRIADASILPVIPAANTLLAVLMTAERVSDFIRRGP